MKENKMNKKIITTLYNHFKNSPKKLKIVCDWDEVIQPCEPYAAWKYLFKDKEGIDYPFIFKNQFEDFWKRVVFYKDIRIEYSPYGSKLNMEKVGEGLREAQPKIKNSSEFYQEAPFLTIAEDLLKLIKEGKVSRLIFLSAYDKKKFPYGDERKEQIFKETFDKVGYPHEKSKVHTVLPCYLELIPFDNEIQGQTKADWIKENASDFDIFIDDNPNICKDVSNISDNLCFYTHKQKIGIGNNKITCLQSEKDIKVIAPHYPAVAEQHDERVLLVKNEVSDLKKEDFK